MIELDFDFSEGEVELLLRKRIRTPERSNPIMFLYEPKPNFGKEYIKLMKQKLEEEKNETETRTKRICLL